MEPPLGDDEVAVCPVIRVADDLSHHHVLPISPLDENIVQQLLVLRSEVHPGGLLPHQLVCQDPTAESWDQKSSRESANRDPSKRQIKPVNTENLLLDDLDDESDDEYVYDGEEADDSSSGSNETDESDESSSELSDETSNDDEEETVADTAVAHNGVTEKMEVDPSSDMQKPETVCKEWSSRECCLCEDKFFAWTGVCISCDAGLCKNYFHVTCAQKQGLLVEPAFEENPSDPFFAQCRQHTDKTVAKGRRRNYLTTVNRCKVLLQMAQEQHRGSAYDITEEFGVSTAEKGLFSLLNERLKRKLEYFRSLYQRMLDRREKPYTRPTKVPLYLENSPVAMRFFAAKALALGLPLDFTGSSAMTEASKSVAPGCPVFLPDFVSYVLDREKRIEELVKLLSTLESTQRELQLSDANVSHNYNSLSTRLAELSTKLKANRSAAEGLINGLSKICQSVSPVAMLGTLLANQEPPSSASSGVAGSISMGGTAAALNSVGDTSVGVGGRSRRGANRQSLPVPSRCSTGPLRRRTRTSESSMDARGEVLESVTDATNAASAAENIIHECSVCNGLRDQHLMVICETCKKAFHIACLDPPLSRVPKQSRLFSWQCSTCTKAVVGNSEVVTVDVDAPRQLRRTSAPAPSHPTTNSPPPNPTPTASKPSRRGRKPKAAADPLPPCPTSSEFSSPRRDQPVVATNKARDRLRPATTVSVMGKPGRRARKRPRKPPVRRVVAEAYPAEIVPSVDPTGASTTLSALPVLASSSFSAAVNHNGDASEPSGHSEPIFLGSASAVVVTSASHEITVPTAVSPAGRRMKKCRVPSETLEPPVSENDDDRDAAEEEGDDEEGEEEDDGADGDEDEEEDEADGDEDEELEDDDSDGLSNLRGSKVKFVQIRDHESPVKETPPEGDAAEPARQCYVICQDNCSTRKKSPTVNNFKMKIRKIE
ncbi:PHD finger protein 14 [Sparganum proliferum]